MLVRRRLLKRGDLAAEQACRHEVPLAGHQRLAINSAEPFKNTSRTSARLPTIRSRQLRLRAEQVKTTLGSALARRLGWDSGDHDRRARSRRAGRHAQCVPWVIKASAPSSAPPGGMCRRSASSKRRSISAQRAAPARFLSITSGAPVRSMRAR